MIRQIEALNYRCLRYVRVPLRDFQILVGPNASGKTAFLDVVGFVGDLLSKGLDEAITARATDIHDLFFCGGGDRFELAVELEIPSEKRKRLPEGQPFRFVRYEVAIGLDESSGEYRIFEEQVILLQKPSRLWPPWKKHSSFPQPTKPPTTIMHGPEIGIGKQRVIHKPKQGEDVFIPEIPVSTGNGMKWFRFRLNVRNSALANLPDDENLFPVSTWLRRTLVHDTQQLMLNSLALRQSSRPGMGRLFRPDGSNLPWIIEELRKTDKARYRQWIEHLQTAMPDIADVETVEMPDTRHRFLRIAYRGKHDFRVPSWAASDGTLRMLALTLPAFLPGFEGIYLIEEPENGIHPLAIETAYQALRSVYAAQILLATHSPVILGCAEPEKILCFKKDESGATDIVPCDKHPGFRAWKDSLTLSELFASGVLG